MFALVCMPTEPHLPRRLFVKLRLGMLGVGAAEVPMPAAGVVVVLVEGVGF
jgi:hypothetical protein